MVRALFFLLLTTAPALSWEARSGLVCELVHEEELALVRVSYDPAVRTYALAVSPRQAWINAPVFALRFDGPRSNIISTNRHVISDNGATLTVTDQGFGNVLDGLEFNVTATALLGDQTVSVSLDGAAPAVRAFRRCATSVAI